MLVMYQFLKCVVSICLLYYILNCVISFFLLKNKLKVKEKKNETCQYNHIWAFGHDSKPKLLIKIRNMMVLSPVVILESVHPIVWGLGHQSTQQRGLQGKSPRLVYTTKTVAGKIFSTDVSEARDRKLTVEMKPFTFLAPTQTAITELCEKSCKKYCWVSVVQPSQQKSVIEADQTPKLYDLQQGMALRH